MIDLDRGIRIHDDSPLSLMGSLNVINPFVNASEESSRVCRLPTKRSGSYRYRKEQHEKNAQEYVLYRLPIQYTRALS